MKQGLDVFIKIKEAKKDNSQRYDTKVILKEIIGDFTPTNGITQEVFNEHYIDYVNKLYLDFDDDGSEDNQSMKSAETETNIS